MPTYDYQCINGHVFEVRAGYQEEISSRTCPDCKHPAHRKQVYAYSILGSASVPREEKRINLKKFQEASAEVAHKYEGGEAPDLYHEGLRRADMVLAGKLAPPKEF